MKALALSILILLSAGYADAQKRAFHLADLYKIRGVSDPRISPDGKRLAFVVSESMLEKGKTNSEVFVMGVEGGEMANVSNHASADNHPIWSPDGKTLYFTSTRENGAQVWKVPAVGGTPERVTNFSMGAGGAELSPDGRSFLFSADVFADCGADDACNKYNDSTMSNGPLQAYVADALLYRHWTEWKRGKVTHTFRHDLVTGAVTDLTPGPIDWPAWEQGGVGYTFSPDGREACIVSNHDPDQAGSTNKDLWLVPLSGGAPKNITAGNKAYDGDPRYSPDGKYIAYKVQKVPGYESDLQSIALYDRDTEKHVVITGEFDNWVNDFEWAPDSKSLYFTGQVEGHVPIYNVEIKSHKIRKVVDVKTIDAFALSGDGKTLVFARRSVGEPVELWRCSSNGKDVKQLTFVNKPLADSVDIRPAEEMWIASPTGKKIHTFIVKPHGFNPNKKYPLIVNVHGGPQSQWADAFRGDWQVYPGSGYIVAFPNPHGSTGYGQEFTAAISKDWNGKVIEDVMAVTDSLENIPWVDKDRIGAMGWSYGGYAMMWLEGHTTRFKAIASMMGVYDLTAMHGATEELWFPQYDLGGTPWTSDLYQKLSPNNSVTNFKTPCLVITGEKDYRVPYTQSLEFFTGLQKMGVPSRLIVFPNDGHWPSGVKSMPLYYNAHLDWFHKYLGGDPAPYDMEKMVRNQAFTAPAGSKP
jgi:dipeptidyl aminopeptidase/acylaminoacyl peptidase